MYPGILIVLISELLIFGNIMLLFYTLVVAFGFHLFVVYYEEPHLRARFSEAYNEYCKKVPRWLIGRTG
jgi:protein-S-isoprenylcysteine O-methyltransferase Ste14